MTENPHDNVMKALVIHESPVPLPTAYHEPDPVALYSLLGKARYGVEVWLKTHTTNHEQRFHLIPPCHTFPSALLESLLGIIA